MGLEGKLNENETITTIDELKEYIPLDKKEERLLRKVVKIHPIKVTKYYLSLINKNDKNDSIRKLIIPSKGELDLSGSYDTGNEKQNTKKVGLQHKYGQTALILATNRCAAYCRHCFRKRLVGLPSKEIIERFDDSVNYIKEHEEITNVLISGGDPFVLPNNLIREFLEKLSPIKHLDFIRFGTRIPVVFPDRILKDKELPEILKKHSENKQVYIITQFNHPREITEESTKAIKELIDSNLIINNQTVLLRGVNDKPEVLAELQRGLVSIGVNPYYVFQCRPVKRVKRYFQVPLCEGYEIVENAKKQLDGHSKRFKYIMSHKTGKIEIMGIKDNEIYLKYHQARNPKNIGRFFKRKLNEKAGWLDDLD